MKTGIITVLAAMSAFCTSCKVDVESNRQPSPSQENTIDIDIRCIKNGNVLNLATYNVGVFNKSGSNSTSMVSKMMKEWDLDAIALNELDSCNTRSGINVNQLNNFAHMMGDWSSNFAGAIAYKSGKYGVGVVTPHGIINRWALSLPKFDDQEMRAVSVIETDKFVFCSCHLGLTRKAQLGQVEEMEKFMEKHFSGYSKPVFFCGDMNAEPNMETITKLQENWTVLSLTEESTFSTSNPVKCIDYIFLYKNAAQVKVKTSFIGRSFKYGDAKTASDHFPVFVQVEL